MERGRITSLKYLICILLFLAPLQAQILDGVMSSSAAASVPAAYYNSQKCQTSTTNCNITAFTPTAGHTLIVVCNVAPSQTCSTPSDGHNTYSVLVAIANDSSRGATEYFIANSVTAVSTTINCTQSSAVGELFCTTLEVSCSSGTCSLDKNPAANAGAASTSWVSNASGSPLATSTEMAISCAWHNNASITSLVGTGSWTAPANAVTTSAGGGCEYQVLSSTAAVTGGFTAGVTNTYLATLVTLK